MPLINPEDREYALKFDGSWLDGMSIHIVNPNGAPNSPNAWFNNNIKITYYLDPSTIDSRPLRSEIDFYGADDGIYFAGDLKGYTFSNDGIGSSGCTEEGGTHNPATNTGHFSGVPHAHHGLAPSTNDLVIGGRGNDWLVGKTGSDSLSGEDGADYIDGGVGNDSLMGEAGLDTIIGGDGNDTIWGGSEEDYLLGGSGADQIAGEAGADFMSGEAGADLMTGGDGNDSLLGGEGNDSMAGDAGNDILSGESGNDSMFGGVGNDTLSGGAGDDTLSGDAGNDYILGEAGIDIMSGGAGDDTMAGGADSDGYIWNAGTGMSYVVESTADAGSDVLVIGGPSDLYVLKIGNHLALGTATNDLAVVYNWYADAGLEAINIGGANYSASYVASLATEISTFTMTMDVEASVLDNVQTTDFSTIVPEDEVSLSGIPAELAEMAALV